jgi:SAM-dependent methyltransferase
MMVKDALNVNFRRVQTVLGVEEYRSKFVQNWISTLVVGKSVIDVGAGLMPFKEMFLNQGVVYTSHDFEGYVANKDFPGLIETDYCVPPHDLVSDIQDLPKTKFDYAICTEVLEHVPNPVLALTSVVNSLKRGGIALFTVPLRSQIHQAPYYFSAGLSPYWFQFHAETSGYKIVDCFILGDSLNELIDFVPSIFGQWSFRRFYPAHFVRVSLKFILPRLRNKYRDDWLSAGGLAVYAIIQR